MDISGEVGSLWSVEDFLRGTCCKCSLQHLPRPSSPVSCGKILQVNGPFGHCHGVEDPFRIYKQCVGDLYLQEGLQAAL